MKHRTLTALLTLTTLAMGQASATVRLGDALPPHPWPQTAGRQLVVLYSHDCGDISALWPALLRAGLPLHAVNAEDIFSPAPPEVDVWRGVQATRFSRALRVSAYPTVLLVSGEHILNAWEGAGASLPGLTR